ncbi:MAG: zinc ribbon domain-containing protein [bacterium]|nr:zinc ribbon domain-containing protein [bacterium]
MFDHKNFLFTVAIIGNFIISLFTIWNAKKYISKKYTQQMPKNKQMIGKVLLITISVVVLLISVIMLSRSRKIIALQSYPEWADSIDFIFSTFFLTVANINFFISSLIFLAADKSEQKNIQIISMASLAISIFSIFIATVMLFFINFCLGIIVIAAYMITPKTPSSIEISKQSSICPKCGSPVSGNKQFCTKCGEKLNTI